MPHDIASFLLAMTVGMVTIAALIACSMALNVGAHDVANNMGPAVGSRALTLTGVSTFTGGTIINGGTLSIGTGGTGANTSTVSALGTGAVTLTAETWRAGF